jgi:hypothetical protein
MAIIIEKTNNYNIGLHKKAIKFVDTNLNEINTALDNNSLEIVGAGILEMVVAATFEAVVISLTPYGLIVAPLAFYFLIAGFATDPKFDERDALEKGLSIQKFHASHDLTVDETFCVDVIGHTEGCI